MKLYLFTRVDWGIILLKGSYPILPFISHEGDQRFVQKSGVVVPIETSFAIRFEVLTEY